MPITFVVTIRLADGTVCDRHVDAFSARWAERVALRTLPEGASIMLACPFIGE